MRLQKLIHSMVFVSFFDNGEIAHLRPSGNAPQLRIYSVADSQERAAEIVALAIAEPNGIFRAIENALVG